MIFLICLSVAVGIGIVSTAIYLATSVLISNEGITTRSLLGTKSLKWSEISSISSQGSSLKLHNHDGDITLSINPRLDGSVEIGNLIFLKRADLFDIDKHNTFSRSIISSIVTFVFGLALVALGLYGYYRGTILVGALVVGLIFSLQGLLSWYSSPRRITLENNTFVVNYLSKSVSYSADDIASIQLVSTQKNQIHSVLVVFRNNRFMKISGFKPTPFVAYPALKQWHQNYASEQPSPSA